MTSLALPRALPWPITIQRLHLKPGQHIARTQALFSYSYMHPRNDGTGTADKLVRDWESPVEGDLVSWNVKLGDTLKDNSAVVVVIQEPCTHDVQLHGLCALCGKDLTRTDYTGFSDTSRAGISMVHDLGGLTVSLAEANKLETETTSRLKKSHKLSLIVDLDQTIIHATVDPTVGEWLADPSNPNFGALDGTAKFRLGGEQGGGDEGCWYFVKMRPGLKTFLETVSRIYEMHVYTMGTRAYASEVCKIIDPDGGLFGGRILSRDESGSLTRKSLQRLFPCDTSMVVIIDDRADVWDGSPNLVKVIPFEFFVGIGDINAAFLPKKKELAGSKPTPPSPPAASSSSSSDPSSPADASSSSSSSKTTTPPSTPPPASIDIRVSEDSGLVSHQLPDSTMLSPSMSEAEASTALTIQDQIDSRPLSHRGAVVHPPSASPSAEPVDLEALDGEEEDDEEVQVQEAVLKDDDRELDRVLEILKAVHGEFFKDKDHTDVKVIIPTMKRQVLAGVNLVFSGIIALGAKPQESDHWRLATLFGAQCSTDISSRVTHVVASQNGTAKVHHARRQGLPVVRTEWLLESAEQWRRLPESPYLIPDTQSSTPLTLSGIPIPPLPPTPDVEPSTPSVIADDEPVDMTEVDWDDAANEVDAFLNETDDDEDVGGGDGGDETDGNDTDASNASGRSGRGGGGPRKRHRPSTDSEDDVPPEKRLPSTSASSLASTSAAPIPGSPLQKRVKTSRSRKSKLKVSFPPDPDDPPPSVQLDLPARGSSPPRSGGPPSPLPMSQPQPQPDGYEPSVGSSSVDSDDDFGSMAAELESGWGE
ncbi:hypothetical protein RQP46_000562 [Phenoliferia psychrophenolica]